MALLGSSLKGRSSLRAPLGDWPSPLWQGQLCSPSTSANLFPCLLQLWLLRTLPSKPPAQSSISAPIPGKLAYLTLVIKYFSLKVIPVAFLTAYWLELVTLLHANRKGTASATLP